MRHDSDATEGKPVVGLFVTCLVDLFRPSVGFAAIKLLEDAGAAVEVPASQTCCGQPAYNAGDRGDAKALARQAIAAFEAYDYVVAPSGSCAAMLKLHYPELLADDPTDSARAVALAAKTYELTSFLLDVLDARWVDAAFASAVTYHDSCSSLRELGVRAGPRRLLASVDGLTLTEMEDSEVCCGFGGAFSVKYPDLSSAIAEGKTRSILQSGASCVVSADLGCLLNIAGQLCRDGSAVECRHVAEILAGMTDLPAIGRGHDG